MKIGNLSVYFSDFTSNGIRFISSMVYIKAKYKSWDTTKYGYNLINKKKKKSMHPASDSWSCDTKTMSRNVKWGLREFCQFWNLWSKSNQGLSYLYPW